MSMIFSSSGTSVPDVWGPIGTVSCSIASLGNFDDSWVLSNFSIGAREIVDIRQCFNDKAYIYALGNNQGQCSASLKFTIFLGKKKCKGGNNTKTIEYSLKKYSSNRISKNTSKTTFTIGSFSCKCWITGINITLNDALRGIGVGSIDLIMELPKG